MSGRMTPEDELLHTIGEAIKENNIEDLEQYANDADLWLTDQDHFSDLLFKGLISTISCPEFLATEGFHVLRIFANNMTLMSEPQRKELLTVLERQYPKFEDATTCMLASEVIGDLFSNALSLEVLMRLSKAIDHVPRALVAYGLGYLGSKTKEKILHNQILQKLTEMKADISEEVRDEAEEAFSRMSQ